MANANKNVTWAASGGGGGGGGGNINCNMPNGGATHVISAGWLTQGVYLTSNAGGFGPNDAIVVKFTTSSITTSTKMGSFNGVEYVDGPTPRYGTLSDTPCDFSTGLPVKGGGQTVFNGDIGISAFFSLFNPKSGGATLAPNTTYYINIANVPGTCGGSCNMQITIKKPGGT